MLRFINQIEELKILSLRNGRVIANIKNVIIDPDKLRLEAFYCQPIREEELKILFSDDVRDLTPRGAIVDSEDNLMESDDLVRLQELIDIDFQIYGKKVITTNKRKVGKVSDATFDDNSFLIEKIYVQPPLLKTFSSSPLIISRRQVVEVTDHEIIVKDVDVKVDAKSKMKLTNPLSRTQPEYPNS